MKKIFHILTAALLVAVALLTTACTNDDIATDDNAAKTVTFTATLAPKGGDGATRVITTGTDANDKETLTTAWVEGEEIAIYYEKKDGSSTWAKATVGTPNADGSATISATLTDAKNGGMATFVYPFSLTDLAGGIDRSKILNNQKGILTHIGSGTDNSISKKYDAAYATGTIAVTDNVASVSGKVTMENQCCICKFDLTLPGTPAVVSFYEVSIAFDGGDTYTFKVKAQSNKLNPFYAAMFPVSNAAATITVTGHVGTSSTNTEVYRAMATIPNVTLDAGRFYRNVPVVLYTGIKMLAPETAEMTLENGEMLMGTGGENTVLKIADGAIVIFNDVDNTHIMQNADIPGIECEGDATIILEGENRVTGHSNAAGIFIPAGKTLTIKGSGTLHATGDDSGAGIGGTENTSCGNIRIQGGTITATGTRQCAGIGSGFASGENITCGDITISGGTVTATGGKWAAGIGSGDNDTGTNTCGNITISGGTVTAQGGSEAAGIGSGHTNQAKNTCGAITISGSAQVTANGGTFAAGIGSGNGNDTGGNIFVSACGAISITSGTVSATGGDDAAGIGSGSYGSFTSITIGSGITRVTATRNNDLGNVPIGGGYEDQGSGAVTFGGMTMYTGKINEWDNDSWTHWPTDGQTYGGINVAVSAYGTEGLTWTLTPAP